ncbi:MAG: LysR family transcriptional regulator [Alphaproteobacteria bacterium]|nr:LysR family transcriptional regulator [Alphaproteobacteria bacterium]
MEIRQIRHFLAIHEAGNFTKAAERLLLSQPALSASIRALEEDLGVQLLERGRRGIALTREGKRFLEHAQTIHDQYESARKDLRMPANAEELRLGAFQAFTIARLATMLKAFCAAHPNVFIGRLLEGTTADVSRLLAQGRVDVILTARMPEDDPAQSLALFEEEYVLVVPAGHRLAQRRSVRIADLQGERFIYRTHCESTIPAKRVFVERNTEVQIVCRTGQDDWAIRLVQAGMGITIMPRYGAFAGTVHVPFEDLGINRTICLRWRREAMTSALQAFRDFAAAHDWTEVGDERPSAGRAMSAVSDRMRDRG